MQGLVTLDFGNTNPHAGLFQKMNNNWELIKVIPLDELQLYLHQVGMSAHNSAVVLCQVKAREDEVSKLQEQGFLVTRLKDYWRGVKFAGMPVHYSQTLGEDRLIEAFYAFKKVKMPTLVIDAGTFVTMDVVTAEGFLGGYIIPGADSYLQTFQRGEQLKPFNLAMGPVKELPQETTQAMTGSYSAFVELAYKLVRDHQLQKIIVTGGQMEQWKNFFQNKELPVAIEVQPNLIHSALHYWYTTQIEPL
jgi:type III pantothenate kinase